MFLPYYCVFKNGQIEPRRACEFNLHDDEEEFLARPRIFTTFLLRRSESAFLVFAADLHRRRLLEDAGELELSSANQTLEERIEHLFQELALKSKQLWTSAENSIRVRMTLGREHDELFLDPFVPRWNSDAGITLVTFPAERPLPKRKTSWTTVSRRASAFASERGKDEALLVDADGFAREGAWSNIFWTDTEKNLYTVGQSILPGVTRAVLFQELSIDFKEISLVELFAAEEIFVTVCTQGVVAVSELDGKAFPGTAGPEYRRIKSLWPDFESAYEVPLFHDR